MNNLVTEFQYQECTNLAAVLAIVPAPLARWPASIALAATLASARFPLVNTVVNEDSADR